MPLKFDNVHKDVILYLRQKFSASFYVGMTVPKKRTNPMIIVLNSGGSQQSDLTSTLRLNIMVWEETWEKSYELSLLVQSYMTDIINREGPSSILDITTNVFPTPTGDGENVETPVHSASYTLFTAASNSL